MVAPQELVNKLKDQNRQNVYLFSDQNGAKTLPDWAAHIYIACIKEYPPGITGTYESSNSKKVQSVTNDSI